MRPYNVLVEIHCMRQRVPPSLLFAIVELGGSKHLLPHALLEESPENSTHHTSTPMSRQLLNCAPQRQSLAHAAWVTVKGLTVRRSVCFQPVTKRGLADTQQRAPRARTHGAVSA